MQMKFVDYDGNELLLPDGFGIQELAPSTVSVALQRIIGRHGGFVESGISSVGEKMVVVKGRIMDCELLEAKSYQAARASALTTYYSIMGFLAAALRNGPVKIYKEDGIIVDPNHAEYDADLAPLGYYIEGYLSGGTSTPIWGGAGNAVIDVTISFVCANPFWQGYLNVSSTAGNIGGGGAALVVPFSVLGSVPARPQLVLYSAAGLSVETGKKITLSIGSLSLDWTGSIPAAGYVVFDCASGQAFSSEAMPAEGAIEWDGATATNKAAGLLDTDDWASRQWSFPTGDYALSVSSNQTAAAAITAYVRFRNEYYG